MHPWKLVAPWYRWPRQINELGVAADPRQTRPAFQKFDDPKFVDRFITDPQRSLVFDGLRDLVQQLVEQDLPDGEACRRTTVYAPKGERPRHVFLCPTNVRKLYLDVHRRYYVVVCELHCDRPGFPRVSFDQVARAGFVVRRRWIDVPRGVAREARAKLKEVTALETQIADLDGVRPMRPAAARRRSRRNQRLRDTGRFEAEREALVAKLVEARGELTRWSAASGVASFHEGWFPTAVDGVGAWRPVGEQPETIDEVAFPMYPVRPDPKDEGHDAAKQTLYFGIIPTSSLDTDAYGAPRFDAAHRYELRCFVQRQVPGCPPPAKPEHAHGEVVWSEASEPYQLARATDPLGCSNRVTTIELPDFREMVALAAVTPAGRLASTRVEQPQALVPGVDADGALDKGGSGIPGAQICFFAIPLITIIAMFIFKLFLPIVVFVFGLWFLLAFKFCIPPSIDLDVGIQAELEADLRLGVDLELSVDVDFTLVTASLESRFSVDEKIPMSVIDLSDQGEQLLATMYVHSPNRTDTPGQAPAPDAARTFGPDLMADHAYEPRVDVEWNFS